MLDIELCNFGLVELVLSWREVKEKKRPWILPSFVLYCDDVPLPFPMSSKATTSDYLKV